MPKETLYSKIEKLESKVDDITENHLPHIREEIASIKGALRWVFLPIVIALILALIKASIT